MNYEHIVLNGAAPALHIHIIKASNNSKIEENIKKKENNKQTICVEN